MSIPGHIHASSRWLKSNQHSYLESHNSTESLVASSRRWIEECTGCLQMDKSFSEYLQDGIVLCELVQSLMPGIIRKINRIRNPFSWRENVTLFLGACSKLGLQDSQLFAPEDVIATTSYSFTNLYKAKSGQPGSDRSLRTVALTICYLALELQSQPGYSGPHIQLGTEIPQPLKLTAKEVHRHSDPDDNPPDSPNNLTSVTSSSSTSSIQSPPASGAKARRVESVTNLITETSSTDIQFYAELVLYLNGSSKEYTRVSNPAPIRLTQSFNRATYSSRASRVQRTLSDRTPQATSKASQGFLQESISDNDIPVLDGNGGVEFKSSGDSRESFDEYPEYRDIDSTTSPSDASTVILRELLSSRCSSNFPVTNEDIAQETDRCSGCDSYSNSPTSSRHTAAVFSEEGVKPAQALSLLIQSGSADTALTDCKTDCSLSQGQSRTNHVVEDTDTAVDLVGEGTNHKESNSASLALNQDTTNSVNNTYVRQDTPTHLNSLLHTSTSPSKQSSKQVTDIHSSKSSNHATSHRENSERHFNCNGGFEQPVECGGKMDEIMQYQHSSNHIADSEPISVNRIQKHGYASSNGTKVVYSVPAGEVPHHSLTLASSDPESPPFWQETDKLGDGNDFSNHHENFNASALLSPKKKNITSLHVGGLDISRVQSDALPHSLLPSMIVCGNDEGDSQASPPKLLADTRSIDTCSTDDIDNWSTTGSPRHCGSPQNLGEPKLIADPSLGSRASEPPPTSGGKEAEIQADLPYATGQTQSKGRPKSAPNRSISTGSVGTKFSTLPCSVAGLEKLREKRKSLDEERQRRTVNIQESTRAALQYSAKRKDSRSETLPRDSRSCSIESTSSNNDITGVANLHFRKSSSPAVNSPRHESSDASSLSPHHKSSNASDTILNTSLNLRHLSIEQTREASLTQMDEIWKQVEATSNKPSERGANSSMSVTSPSSVTTDVEDNRNASLSPSLDPKDIGIELDRSPLEPDERRRSDVLMESDILISIMEPVAESTPLRPEGDVMGGASVGNVHGGRGMEALELPFSEGGRSRSKAKNRPTSFSNKDIDSLLSTLKSLSSNEEDEDLKILEDMLKSNTFKKAKHVHDDMRLLLSGAPSPARHRIVPSTQLMRQHLRHHTEPSGEVDELRHLLRSPHIQAVLFCHDKVSSHDLYVPDAHFHPTAHDPVDIILSASIDNFQAAQQATHYMYSAVSSRDVPFNRKEGATIVYLERTNRPLGCTIYKQDDAVFIGKLLKGCDAEASDMLREGDELLEVNGISVMGKRTDDIIRLMSGDVQTGTTLAFTIIPVHDESYDIDYEPKYMRAHFNYDGTLDDEIPCKVLGMSFQKGDIMEIVNQDEPDWWQACKVFEENAVSLPGLIPSMHLQQQRESLRNSYSYPTSSSDTKKGLRGIFSRRKKKKIYYQSTSPSNIVGIGDEIPTYEQVMKLDPDPSLCRPIILVGAPGVGCRTLIRKLLNSDPSLYQPVVQHTTRLIRPGEVNGHDYHFVTREEFESDVQQDRFLEYGEFRGHFHGTGFSSIKKIMESGRVPVLDIHPQALKKIRHSGLRPYIVFVASPRLERLQLTRKISSEKLKRRLGSSPHHRADLEDTHVYTESDLQHLVNESYLIENQYGHYFDWIIVNDDFHVAADMLKEVSRRLEVELQWVPYAWKNY